VSIGNQQLLQRYARPIFISSATDDTNQPFSYKEWYNSHQGIIPGQEFKQYNEYLVNWYRNKNEQVTDTKLQLKLNYLALLKQLQLFFSQQEAENWYNNINVNDERELLLAIPYFAKKLKDISLYYLQLRETLKHARLKYNQTGTSEGIIEQLQKFILTNYTQKPNTSIAIPASIWKNVPALSSIKDTITVEIEELYDSHNYFDHSPTVPISSYYNVTDPEVLNFLQTKNLLLTSAEWIYKLGVNPLSADYTSIVGTDLTELSNQLTEKYLGFEKYISSTQSISTQKDFYDITINQGNNFFYWPTGVYPSQAKSLPRYNSVSIQNLGLETVATAGSSLEIADTIFVKTTQGVEGAWLRNILTENTNQTMEATLNASSTTRFRFPFPGFGLSAEGIDWTGYGLKTNPQFLYLDSTTKENVENVYWSTNITLSAITPLSINDTSLIGNKAFASEDYNQADKIRVWLTTPQYSESVYSDEEKQAWLYKMSKTDISIKQNGNTVIYWPFQQIDTETDFPTYFPKNISDFCAPVPVSSLSIPQAIANTAISGADVIYKIRNYQDSIEDAYECCWLSGNNINIPQNNIIVISQQSLQGIFNADSYSYFVWNGPDTTDIETVFKSNNHQPDCKFVTTPNTTYKNTNLCTCKQVLFTPFGHPGSVYTDNSSFADFIVEDNFSPSEFDLTTWKDDSGSLYTTSSAFCWYKTNQKIEWGNGRWYSGSSAQDNKFYLRTGKKYMYYRAGVQKENKETFQLPELVIRHSYNTSTNPIWIKGIKDTENNWFSTQEKSSMVIYPGDLLLYRRFDSTFYNLTGTTTEVVDIAENRGSIWTSFDYISLNSEQQVVLSYPSQTFLQPISNSQYPAIGINNILSIFQWSVSGTNLPLTIFRNAGAVTFTPQSTGLYTFSVTAVSATQLGLGSYSASTSGYYRFTNIPALTVVPDTIQVPTLTSYPLQAPGFVLNVPLFGWEYNTGTANPFINLQNKGARPFWAKSYINKDENTGYKTILSWGTPQRFVDGYNILTQPEISDIVFNIGTYVEYIRKYPSRIVWSQPVEFINTINKKQWCSLTFNTTVDSNLNYLLNNYTNDLVAQPTTSASNIVIQNFVDNEPVEIYYNAINSFAWSITAVPETAQTAYEAPSALLAITPVAPWANLSNQYYPTVAAFPTVEDLHKVSEIGGFFTPNNLGISVYLDKDYTTTLCVTGAIQAQYFNDINIKTGGRGFTLQDQSSLCKKVEENNIWLKEPTIAGPIAGTIKKDVFKKYQKFIPYQSGYESNPQLTIGLLNPTSRQTPWTGKEDSEWGDLQNYPVSYTGELQVSNWADAQVLKQVDLQVDNWVTDIFGNQYGLYKSIKNVSTTERKNVGGEIWVRKNSQFVLPGSKALAGVYDSYVGTTFSKELTGTGVRKIDMFFDTLLIELSGVVLFEKLVYDYNTDNIFSLTDEARQISLIWPPTNSINRELTSTSLSSFTFAKAGETWFYPNEKQVIQSIGGVNNNILLLEFYQLNLNTQNFKKVFPLLTEDITSINSLSSLGLIEAQSPTLSYNTLKKEYTASILGKNNQNKNTLIEFKIINLPTPALDTITVYNTVPDTVVQEPPVIVQDLFITLYTTPSAYTDVLNFQCTPINGPATFTSFSFPSWGNISSSGLITGTPPRQTATYNATFKATNNVGPAFYNLTINVILVIPPELNYIIYDDETGTGYLIDDDGGRFYE